MKKTPLIPTNSSDNFKKVLILVKNAQQHDRDLLLGIANHARLIRQWSLFGPHDFYSSFGDITNCKQVASYITKWKIDGVIIREPDDVGVLLDTGIPIIMFPYASDAYPQIPALLNDAATTGKTAARYYLDRGFKNLAFCGYDLHAWSRGRCESFVQEAASAGLTVHVYKQKSGKTPPTWIEEQPRLTQWLTDLPKPVGVFACNDSHAQQVAAACKIAQLEIPYHVSVLGVDNDETICNLSSPPLSSIHIDTQKVGFEAAQLLDQLMQGQKMQGQRIFDSVIKVISRESTDLVAVRDETIRAAIQFIYTHARNAIQVRDVAEAAGVSEWLLAKKFRGQMGHSINTLIKRIRIELIKNMIEADTPIAKIAELTNFSDVHHISRYFRRETGLSPTEYKKSLHL